MAFSLVPGIAVLLCGFITAPEITLMTIGALVAVVWCFVGYGWLKKILIRRAPLKSLLEKQLPTLTILLPLNTEANMVQQLSDMLRQIDYPGALIDCLVLLESDDHETALASLNIDWPDFVRIVTVPEGTPRTKARACNYGLLYSAGEIVVIFDAEDKPHPQQMREAAAKFAAADQRLACLQAPLHIVPHPDNWLQAQFALEYALLFYVKLPGLDEALECLPLGGSSNYFRRSSLLQVGGWDAYNLTEDADLALRFAGYGYRIGTLRHPTIENAPHNIAIWHSQRTRWLSGHIQTLHAYAAWHLKYGAGDASHFHWRPFMLAALAVMMVRLISGIFFIASAVLLLLPFELQFPSLFTYVSLGFYSVFFSVLIYLAPNKNLIDRLVLAATHPIYWTMTFIPLLYAIKRMV